MTKRILLGSFLDGGYGLRCSKPGHNAAVLTPDPANMIFDSSWGAVLPIHYMSGVFGLAPGATSTIFYPTALGYSPFMQLLQSDDNVLWYFNPNQLTYNLGTTGYLQCSAFSDHVTVINHLSGSKYLFWVVFRAAI